MKTRPKIQAPDYPLIGELRADLIQIAAKYQALCPAMALTLGIKARFLTEHGDETVTGKVTDIPPLDLDQMSLPGMDIDLDTVHKERIRIYRLQLQKEREEREKGDGDQGSNA